MRDCDTATLTFHRRAGDMVWNIPRESVFNIIHELTNPGARQVSLARRAVWYSNARIITKALLEKGEYKAGHVWLTLT